MGKGFVEYSETIGKILANLQALEFLIRRFLCDKADPPFSPLLSPLNDLKLRDVAPENSLTDWSTLGDLIGRYNRRVEQDRPDLVVSKDVVALRDALAHARVWLPEWPAEPDAPPLLLKFAKPKDGSAPVEFVQLASSEWLDAAIKSVGAEVEKVVAARKNL